MRGLWAHDSRVRWWLAGVLVVVAAGVGIAQAATPVGRTSTGLAAEGASPAAVAAAARGPCGARARPPATYRHVIWIVFENQSLGHVIGNRALPFTNRLAARCGLATRFFAEAHPSLPNYLAMTSGGTQGVTGDSSGPLAADNIYAQVHRSGRQWRHYAFGMPRACDPRDAPSSSRAIYTAHHEPPVFYRSIARDCRRWDVGVGDPSKVEDFSDVRRGPLADALRRNRLPAFATLGPTDDGGNSAAGGEVDPVKGDAFLARWIPRLTASRAYRGGRTAIFITWDEPDDFGGRPQAPIPTIVVAPSVRPGRRVAARLDHYAMLRTTEDLLRLRGHLGAAAHAPSMRRAFRF